MPPLASPFAHTIDKAIERNYFNVPDKDLAAAAGGWATVHALRPAEVGAALGGAGGPLSGFTAALPGGATSTVPIGLGALATAIGASAGAYKLKMYPEA